MSILARNRWKTTCNIDTYVLKLYTHVHTYGEGKESAQPMTVHTIQSQDAPCRWRSEHPLLLKLAALQDDAGHSDRAFASLLGITHSHWSHIRAGTAHMGHKTLRAVARTFPHLREDVVAYLADR
jgi:hypothetical protein